MVEFQPGSKVRLTSEGARRLKHNEQAKRAALFSGVAVLATSICFDGGIGIGAFGTAIGVSEGTLVGIASLLSAVVAALSVEKIQQMEGVVVIERVSKAKVTTTVIFPSLASAFGLMGMLRGQNAASLFTIIDVDWRFKDAETGKMHYLRRSHLGHHLILL